MKPSEPSQPGLRVIKKTMPRVREAVIEVDVLRRGVTKYFVLP